LQLLNSPARRWHGKFGAAAGRTGSDAGDWTLGVSGRVRARRGGIRGAGAGVAGARAALRGHRAGAVLRGDVARVDAGGEAAGREARDHGRILRWRGGADLAAGAARRDAGGAVREPGRAQRPAAGDAPGRGELDGGGVGGGPARGGRQLPAAARRAGGFGAAAPRRGARTVPGGAGHLAHPPGGLGLLGAL